MKSITIKDIAKICGVGITTVSRAINNHPDINPVTKEKILSVIEEYNYVPNNSARNLKLTETNTIAILVKAADNPFFFKMIGIFEKEIRKSGFDYFLQHVEEQQDEISVAIELEKERKLKGIIFLGGRFMRTGENLRQIHVPYVLSTIGVNHIPEGSIGTCIAVDDRKESYKIVDYLCKLGHKKIAMLAAMHNDESVGKFRIQGYKDALQENGIAFDENLIMHMLEEYEPYSMQSGYEMTKKLLADHHEFTAIVGISDTVAIGACKAIFESGRKIPEDCSIVGFDGIEQAFYYVPSITTIRQPLKEIAKASIDALFTMLRTEKSVESRLFEGELLQRQSTRKL